MPSRWRIKRHGRVNVRACPRAKSPPNVLPPRRLVSDRRSFRPASLGQAEAGRRDHLFDLDRRWALAANGLRGAARGQAGRAGAARSCTGLVGGSGRGSISGRQSGVDVNRTLWIAADVAFGRKARLRGSPRDGPECAPKSPFHIEREIGFTAQSGPTPIARSVKLLRRFRAFPASAKSLPAPAQGRRMHWRGGRSIDKAWRAQGT